MFNIMNTQIVITVQDSFTEMFVGPLFNFIVDMNNTPNNQ